MKAASISHGPFLGDLTESSIKIWFRSSREREEKFIVRVFSNQDEVDFLEVSVAQSNDYIGLASFKKLKNSTTYEVKIYLAKELLDSITFKTKASKKQDLSFVFGSCRYNHWNNSFKEDASAGDETYREIQKVHNKSDLDFLLFLGDQIYADPTYSVGICQDTEDFSGRYKDSFSQPHFQQLLSEVPSYMILDDHEIRDNWSRDMLDSFSFFENREEIYRNGIKNYELWQHSRNPDTVEKQYWYSFIQSGFSFFVLDIRTKRTLNPQKNRRKTMLGDKQLGELFEWLHSTKGQAVRFIGSGVPFCPDPLKKEDKWCAFEEERNLILEFIRVEKIGKTVFLSGDVHIGVNSKMTCVQDDSFEVHNLVSSPLYWPYRGMYIKEFHKERTLSYDQWVDSKRMYRGLYDYQYSTSNWVRENQFAEVKVKEDGSGSIRHFNMKSGSFEEQYYF